MRVSIECELHVAGRIHDVYRMLEKVIIRTDRAFTEEEMIELRELLGAPECMGLFLERQNRVELIGPGEEELEPGMVLIDAGHVSLELRVRELHNAAEFMAENEPISMVSKV